MYRTGLAIEAAKDFAEIKGAKVIRRRVGRSKVTDIRLDNTAAKHFGKSAGRYITIEGEPCEGTLKVVLTKALELLLPRGGTVLCVGLGNPDISRDSLGSQCVNRISAVCGRRRLCVMETDIAAKTGIETADMVRAVACEISAACVLAIDALACADPLRIGKTVQLTDTGVQPGSGVWADMPSLTADYIELPVIAIGVPMVSELSGITGNPHHGGYLAAPPNEDLCARLWAETIADSVNTVFE